MSKKDTIINVATTLFNKYSYNAVGIDKIISESNVAKMTFYKYFQSKENLIEACLAKRNLDIQSAIEMKIVDSDTPIQKLNNIYNWFIDWMLSDDFNGCMFNKASLEVLHTYPSARKPIDDYRNWLACLIQGLFIELKIKNYQDSTSLFISILDGLIVGLTIGRKNISPSETWSYVLKFIEIEEKL
ncbi:TetR/AcrR family transcriptional regulator [Acinetobacter sp. ANC 4648]|uniref:TetR/AcrR family transcriptional regulator n=1 Tax=Acinetobacter sp. ANC 4648 TaxID=1977875 RepID=UPI000A34F4E1|nr:TetR/AcrR family transcriptional regulator [Acinetobacter sp. ANC 4648]OTG82176.1 TetR family transcriptional regulator [Acinetobacter sp. ANC 4648]